MVSKWQRLHISNQGPVPPLLFKYSFTQNGYDLYMTDLTYIWSEHLNRQHILRRADEDDATIDPSENAGQLDVLLQKVGEALRNEPGSSTVLNNHGSGIDSLQLITSTKLPSPLRPLEWNIYLSKEPQSSSTGKLLLPLIKAEAAWVSRQQTLIDQLKRKDWALGKLFDKLEAMGIDLGTIFPNTTGLRAGHKGSMLSQATKYIKGVAPFDEQAWLDETNASPDLGLANNILTEASASGLDDYKKLENLNPPSDGWWKKLTAAVTSTTKTSPEHEERSPPVNTKPSKDPRNTEIDDGAETEDDEFERQETPSRLRRPPVSKDKSPPPRMVEETESEGEDEGEDVKRKPIATKPPRTATQPKPPAKPSMGLGRIGGQRAQSPPKQEPLQPSPPPLPDNDNDSDRTESGSDSDNPPSPPPNPKPSTITNPRRGLGVIGGKKKEQPASPPPPQSPEPQPEPEPQRPIHHHRSSSTGPKTRQPGRLGLIGGRKPAPPRPAEPTTSPSRTETPSEEDEKHEPVKPSSRDVPRSKSAIKRSSSPEHPQPNVSPTPSPPAPAPAPPPEPEREETEQERADRKRDELKRQLEAKSKAPAKKKRKF
ncbi:XLF-domain-containing protein [Aspergillus ellipticus CBS 707.79]|uniref:Non-homologous end-joining factor 1 n=1 Tax=Aspergillus ellipticus CBS 707.79 TaxID=1448320 RepID=A0A319CZE3_9EURO|nr:XLF-domain-containing protein [Aspergillus ellipticus CBS 707.79]